jgi:hypothetical protein
MRIMRAVAVVAAGAGLFAAAGCTGSAREPATMEERRAAQLADVLREEALTLPEDAQRERLVSGLIMIRNLLQNDPFGGGTMDGASPLAGSSATGSAAAGAEGQTLPEPPGGASPAPPWAVVFAPKSLVIGFFTRSRNFNGTPGAGPDGIEVRLQPLDQFGDPAKAVGSYRIEVFEYRPRSGEKRGIRLGHWFVSVLDVDAQRKYYDSVDRSYVLPLLWEKPIAVGTSVIVQATYYPPGGFTEKLFAQRVIKIGVEGE